MKIKFNEFLNEGWFSKTSTDDKLIKLSAKYLKYFNEMADEAWGEINLSKGAELGYKNFGRFVDACYDIIDIIKDEIEKDNFDNFYKHVLDDMKETIDKVNYVTGVSEISTAKFKFVKRNLDKMLEVF